MKLASVLWDGKPECVCDLIFEGISLQVALVC